MAGIANSRGLAPYRNFSNNLIPATAVESTMEIKDRKVTKERFHKTVFPLYGQYEALILFFTKISSRHVFFDTQEYESMLHQGCKYLSPCDSRLAIPLYHPDLSCIYHSFFHYRDCFSSLTPKLLIQSKPRLKMSTSKPLVAVSLSGTTKFSEYMHARINANKK